MDRILHDVRLIPQRTNQTCWYACADMIVEYHREHRQQSTIAGGAIGMPHVDRAVDTANNYIPWRLVESFARQQGFQMLHLSPTPRGLLELLQQHGPLWYGGDWSQPNGNTQSGQFASGHVIVITGCHVHGDAAATVYLNDPWPVGTGAQRTIGFERLFNALLARGEVPFLYLPSGGPA